MARGILIFGSAGAGKTTLGHIVAAKLGYPYYDIDDYIWMKNTKIPFSLPYPRAEKARRLMEAISQGEHFVMGGSMDSFNEPFVPLFDLAVYLTTNTHVRIERLKAREYERYGDRILEGGDLYAHHQSFLKMAARYDSDGSPNADNHAAWASTLPCTVLRLSGDMAPEVNADIIVRAYRSAAADRAQKEG